MDEASAVPSDLEDKWKEREGALLKSIDVSISYYTRRARTARIWYRVVGVVILICVVIAPVAVVTGVENKGLSAFGIPASAVTAIAVASTILMGLAEGLQRTFQFEQRWITCIKAREGPLEAHGYLFRPASAKSCWKRKLGSESLRTKEKRTRYSHAGGSRIF